MSVGPHPLSPPAPGAGTAPAEGRRPVVAPFARALSILCAFTPADRWLCNGELADRTGLPRSTARRMTGTLVALGYLRCADGAPRFCLGPSALALGYRAAADADIHHESHQRMARFAEQHQVQVHLSTRERLELVVIDSCSTRALPAALQPGIGTRADLASTAAGWALLAGLPDAERDYLLRSARPHAGADPDGRRLRRRSSEAIGQVREGGFCVALGESGRPMTVVAAPIRGPGQVPLALSCMGPSRLVGRTRSERELGPALACMADELRRVRGQA